MLAITRAVSPAIVDCQLTHLARAPIDLALACAQHAQYEEALSALGCSVQALPAAADLPDSVFVEDVAVVVEEVAVLTRPGAATRRPETAAVAAALRPHRPLQTITAPGTLDGGDVLRLGRTLFVGRSGRSNAAGIAQLATLLAPYGYRVRGVPVHGCLHLKSAVTALDESTLLLNRAWVEPQLFGARRVIDVHRDEPFAANALAIGDRILFPTAFPRTAERLTQAGYFLYQVDVSELAKAEGAVTCCSLILDGG